MFRGALPFIESLRPRSAAVFQWIAWQWASCCATQGHAGAQQTNPGSPEDQRDAASHCRSLRSVLAAAECLQYAVWLAPPGAPRLPARRHLFRLSLDSDGLHLHQPRGVWLPQQQLPEGAEGHPAALPVQQPHHRELRELPPLHRGQRGSDKSHFHQQDGIGLRPLSPAWGQHGNTCENNSRQHRGAVKNSSVTRDRQVNGPWVGGCRASVYQKSCFKSKKTLFQFCSSIARVSEELFLLSGMFRDRKEWR